MKLFIFNNKKKKISHFEIVISQLILLFLFFSIFYQEKSNLVQSVSVKMKVTSDMLLTKSKNFSFIFNFIIIFYSKFYLLLFIL